MLDAVHSYDKINGFELIVETVGDYSNMACIGYVFYKGKMKYRTPVRFHAEMCRQEIFKDLEAYLENFGAVSIDK